MNPDRIEKIRAVTGAQHDLDWSWALDLLGAYDALAARCQDLEAALREVLAVDEDNTDPETAGLIWDHAQQVLDEEA